MIRSNAEIIPVRSDDGIWQGSDLHLVDVTFDVHDIALLAGDGRVALPSAGPGTLIAIVAAFLESAGVNASVDGNPNLVLKCDDGEAPMVGNTIGAFFGQLSGPNGEDALSQCFPVVLPVQTRAALQGNDIMLVAAGAVSAPGPVLTATPHGGVGYVVGDTGQIGETPDDPNNPHYLVDAVDGGGAVTALTITDPGAEQTPREMIVTQRDGGVGVSLTVTIDTVDDQFTGTLHLSLLYRVLTSHQEIE